MELAYKIRRKREEKGYSQDFMAIQMDISQKTYGRIENGESKIDFERLKIISDILEIDPLELLKPDEANVFNNHDQQGGKCCKYSYKPGSN